MREIRAKLASPPQARLDGYGIDHDLWIAYVDGVSKGTLTPSAAMTYTPDEVRGDLFGTNQADAVFA
jgi:hypothetical protein